MHKKLDVETLDKLITHQHKTGNIRGVLPFVTKDVKARLQGEVRTVLGEFSRQVCSQTLENDQDPLHLHETSATYDIQEKTIIERMTADVTSDNEDDRYDLERLLSTLLFNNEKDVQAIHPHIFLYYPLSKGKRGNLEKRVAHFLKDVLVIDQPTKVADVFNKKNDEDLLVSMILHHLDELEDDTKPKGKNDYQSLLPSATEMFIDDFFFLSSRRDFFLEHFELFLHHYYFLYVSQLTFKFAMFTDGNYSHVNPLYYSLDWESLNKRRKAFNDVYSFKGLRDRAPYVFVHVHTQSQLSHNWLNNEGNTFMTYNDLSKKLENEASDNEKAEFLDDLNEWLTKYASKMNFESPQNSTSIKSAIKNLYNSLKEGMSSEVCKNYGKLVEDAAFGKFLKARGSLGHTLNITQDFLLMLTALAVKNRPRIALKELFVEFEKRGIKLDRYSQKEVVDLLDSLNIIEKKSDSGDAQYVKPIL
ncbi:DNA phosphorothioation-dependent restriction protein DptG [Salipaludibacillus daqingensis]|uniref:DNA phosphorothioation-dependent restriction protein DptG n=1 Tax=Salipaludibacillus daqingensis TaxID=3041001 RepID=UPI0024761EAE|nr:DNA phosphorothioation-dependent restriction protein DptG [Salipaludibacillus daqingensis]